MLPTAVQAIITGIVGLRFFFLRAWQPLRLCWPNEPAPLALRLILRGLGRGLLLVLLGQFTLAAIQTLRAGFLHQGLWTSLEPYLRLAGKQGLYGSFLVLSFLLAATHRPKPPRQGLLIQWHIISPLLLLLLAYMLGQRNWGWDWVHGLQAKLGDHRFAYGVFRASGFMGHPISMAYNCLLFAMLSFAQGLWLWRQQRKNAWGWWFLTVILLTLLQLTGSRFPLVLALVLIACSGALQLMRHTRLKLWLLLASLLGALSMIVVLSTFDQNLSGRWAELWDLQIPWQDRFDRVIFWKVNLGIFSEHPWLGTGLADYDRQLLDYYNRAGYTLMERKYAAHNIFLQTMADSGILGTIVLLFILGVWLRAAVQVYRQFQHQAMLLIWLATVLGGLMQNNLRDSEYLFALWVSLGVCSGCLLAGVTKLEPESRRNLKDHQP